MSNRFDFGGINLRAGDDYSTGHQSHATRFCIAIIGDFSGRGSRGVFDTKTLAERRAHLIDRDNFDEVLSDLKVELHLPSGGESSAIFNFSELDDFHPDRLLENKAFNQLRQLRERLEDPTRFTAVAEEIGLLRPQPVPAAHPSEARASVSAPDPTRLASGSLLDQLVEETEFREPSHPRRRDSIHDFARELSSKYAVSAPDARQTEVLAAIDRATGDAMRAILHHPQFQALEAIWRSTFLLVRALDTDSQLRISIFDISRDELAADLHDTPDIQKTGISRLFVEKGIQTPGADPWSAIVGAYRFGAADQDFAILDRLSKIAHAGGAVFISEALPTLLGCESVGDLTSPRNWKAPKSRERWSLLRSAPDAESTALALPRWLVRLPYGRKTSPLESFEFEEFQAAPVHDEYLWGNPAFVVALLLGQSFNESGGEMRPGSVAQVDHLPLHIYESPGGPESQPCAEALLTDGAVQEILDHGLIPLIAFKGRDSLRIGRFQPIAGGNRPLLGLWTRR